MKKFVFKLEPLYEYRQRLEEVCKKEFRTANARLDEEESKLAKLHDAYSASSGEIDAMKEKGAPVEELALYYTYLTGLRNHIKGQEKIIAEFRTVLDRKRAELMEASRSKRVVEIMKEKSVDSYVEDLNRQEQKVADDMAGSRYARGAGYEK